MDKRETVTPWQMGTLLYLYMTGSSIINVPAPLIAKAGNGAWVSLLISGGLGMCILGCMLFLYRRYPGLTYVEFSHKLMGTWLTAAASVFPLSFYFHSLTGIVLDADLFMITSMMTVTPMYAFSFLIFMVAALTVRAGFEVMTRMFTLILILTAVVIILILLLAIGDYHPEYLRPIMPDGIKPVLRGAYFSFGFPYAEVILFSMLLPFARKGELGQTSRYMIIALILNILSMAISVICTIMIFGPLAGEKNYSLYNLARTVEVQEIISGTELAIGIALIADSCIKTAITLFYLSLFLSQLLRLNDYRTIVMPISMLAFLNTLDGYDGDMEWGEIVGVIHPVWVFLAVLPLLVLTVVALFRDGSAANENRKG